VQPRWSIGPRARATVCGHKVSRSPGGNGGSGRWRETAGFINAFHCRVRRRVGRRALSLGWCGNALTTPVRLTTRSWACAQAHARAAVCQQQLPPRWSPPGRAPHGRRRRRSEPAPGACAARATTVCRGIWGGDGLPPRGRRSAGDMINLSTQLGERGCCLRAGPRVHASSGAAI
jgi:hypothetical protein